MTSVPVQVTVNLTADDVERRAVAQIIREEMCAAVQSGEFAGAARLAELRLKELLTTEEVSMLFGIGEDMLKRWRVEGLGPRYSKPGAKTVLYRPEDVREFLSKKMVRTYDAV